MTTYALLHYIIAWYAAVCYHFILFGGISNCISWKHSLVSALRAISMYSNFDKNKTNKQINGFIAWINLQWGNHFSLTHLLKYAPLVKRSSLVSGLSFTIMLKPGGWQVEKLLGLTKYGLGCDYWYLDEVLKLSWLVFELFGSKLGRSSL